MEKIPTTDVNGCKEPVRHYLHSNWNLKKKKEKNLPYISFSFLSHDKDKCHGDRRGKETLARC